MEKGRGERGVEDARVLVVDEVAEVEDEFLRLAPEGQVWGDVFEVFPPDSGRDDGFGG